MSKIITVTEAILLAAEEFAIPVSIKEVMNSIDKTVAPDKAHTKAAYINRVARALPGLSDESIVAVATRVEQIIEKG